VRNRQEYNKRSTDLQKKMQLKGEVRPAMSGDLINSFSASEMCDPLHEMKMGRGRQGQSEGGGGSQGRENMQVYTCACFVLMCCFATYLNVYSI
jgi:hypothetical protein